MAATLREFVQWAKEKVVENPEIANYNLIVDDSERYPGPAFELDNDAGIIVIYVRDPIIEDEEPDYEDEDPF